MKWGSYDGACDENERFPASGAVRFEPLTQIQEIEIPRASPMTRYGLMPEVRVHAMVWRYFRPRGRDTWEIRQNYLVRCHTTPRWGLFTPDSRKLPDGIVIQGVSSDRCTQILFLTSNQEQVARTRTIRDDWTSPDEGKLRLEGWWVGETMFRVSEESMSPCRPNGFPPEIHAVARGANARLNMCPGDASVRHPVYRDESIITIAVPLCDRLEE